MRKSPPAWELIQQPLPEAILHAISPLAPLQVQLLTHRAIASPVDMIAWMAADLTALSDPNLLPDSALAVTRIHQAVDDGELIGIVGDCDVDGLTATAILQEALTQLGAHLAPAIITPRTEDGRGLTNSTAQLLIANGVRLCITVDNGSGSQEEIAVLHQVGIDTIVTDHHHILPSLPAYALVNPQRSDSVYPNPALSGAGIAYQLARLLLTDNPATPPYLPRLLELAGLGTLADIVPITLENRVLIIQGLRQMAMTARPGLRALLALVNRDQVQPSLHDISFGLAPRLNAAGRIADPLWALRLLLTSDETEAAQLAQRLEDLNRERQQQTEETLLVAEEQARQQMAAGESMIFVTSPHWPVGIVGLIANRLAEEYDCLAVAIAQHGDKCRGSLRGPTFFDVATTLATLDPPLEEAGGHSRAGGFMTTVDNLARLRAHLHTAYQAAIDTSERQAMPIQKVDASIPLAYITWERIEQVKALEPFGTGFATPLFVSPGVQIKHIWPTQNGQHLKIVAEQDGYRRTFFWRRGGSIPHRPIIGARVDILWQIPYQRFGSGAPEPRIVTVMPGTR